MPFKKVNGWALESYWIIGGLFSWLIVPPLAAYLTVPGFAAIIGSASGNILGITYLMGLLWGGLTTNLIWTTILNLKNKTYGNFTDLKKPLLNNYFFAALA
jgi:hypothetical protein